MNNKLRLNVHKIKAIQGHGLMFVSFKTVLDKNKALELLNGYAWKGKTLTAQVRRIFCVLTKTRRNGRRLNYSYFIFNLQSAKGVEDPLVRKRVHEKVAEGETGFVTDESLEDAMKRVTIPWVNIPYGDQVKATHKNTL